MLGLGLSITSVSGLRSLASKLLGILRSRSTYSENNVSSNATIDAIDNAGVLDDATILLTPTAYSNARVHSAKTYTGDELVINGDFSDGLSGWTEHSGSLLELEGGRAKVTTVSSQGYIKRTDLSIQSGNTYFFTAEITNATSPIFYINGVSNFIVPSLISGDTYGGYITATGDNPYFYIRGNNTSGQVSYIDNVSVLDVSSDFDFDRASSATRINSDGLVQDMQSITDPELVQNGDFEELGSEVYDDDITAAINGGTWVDNGDGTFTVTGDGSPNTGIGVRDAYADYLTNGKTYKWTVEGDNVTLALYDDSYSLVTSGTSPLYFTATATNRLYISPSDGVSATYSNVSIKQVDPNDRWTVTSSDANNYVEFTEGFARLKFLNTSPITMLNSTLVLEANKTYELVVDVHDVTSGAIKIDAGGLSETFNTEGVTTRYLKPTGNTTLSFYRATANVDITLASVSVKDITFADDVDLARINYDSNGENGHWLLEPTSTNLVPYSEDFTEYSISTTNLDTPTIVSITNPTGVSSAGLLNINNGVSASKFIYLAISTSSSIHTQSIFVKYVDRQWIQLLSGGTSHYANFDIQNGVVGNTSGCSSTIEDYGNGWYRCTATLDSAATPINLAIAVIDDNTATRLSASTGTGSYYLFGGQVEAKSYATSYIPTLTGSTVTRATETLTGSGNSTLINSTEGVLYAEIAALENTNSDKNISISDGTNSNRVGIYYYGNTMSAVGYLGGANQFYLATSIPDVKEFIKVAIKYKDNDFALWIDGVKIATDTSGTVPSGLNSLQFDNGGGGGDFYGNCKALTVFDRALTDQELTDLTS